jgi:predicted DNA-binding protein
MTALSPILPLRDAIRALLRADAGFKAIAGNRIYDDVPTSTATAPYAYVGPMRRSRYEIGCGLAWTVQARLYAVSTANGRTEAWSLIDAMSAALEGLEDFTPALAEPFRLQKPIEVTQAGDVIDPLQAKSVFLDLTTIIAGPGSGLED